MNKHGFRKIGSRVIFCYSLYLLPDVIYTNSIATEKKSMKKNAMSIPKITLSKGDVLTNAIERDSTVDITAPRAEKNTYPMNCVKFPLEFPLVGICI